MGSRTMNWDRVRQEEKRNGRSVALKPKNQKSLYAQYGKLGRCMKTVSKGKRCANPIKQHGKIMCDDHLKEDVLLQ